MTKVYRGFLKFHFLSLFTFMTEVKGADFPVNTEFHVCYSAFTFGFSSFNEFHILHSGNFVTGFDMGFCNVKACILYLLIPGNSRLD